MNKKIIVTGAVLIVVGIILGAFGAHALKDVLTEAQQVSFETGVRYQMYHGFALLILGANADRILDRPKWVISFLLSGVLLFSVSIYLLALQKVMGVQLTFLGPVTPIGGVLMILGWGVFIKNLLSVK